MGMPADFNPTRTLRSFRTGTTVPSIIAATAALFAPVTIAQSSGAMDGVTYHEDVEPIVNDNCVVCHREGGIAPMALDSYELVSGFAPLIRQKVVSEEMPPYSYDRDVGIQALEEDWRLSEEQIDTIAAWVDQGATRGNPDNAPVAPDLPDPSEWTFVDRYGPPDLVVPSTPIDVPAGGNDMWHRPQIPTGLAQDRCIRAVQVKPAGDAKAVVHHANSRFLVRNEEGELEAADRLTEYAMGKVGELIPDGVCRRAPANAYVDWDIHLYPGGIGRMAPGSVIEDNVVEIGIWFHPEDYEPRFEQDLASYGVDRGEMVVPPHGVTMQQDFHSFDHPVRIDSFQPHGHLRMVAASLEVYYPGSGEMETISMISNWSAQWHHSHIYEEDAAPLIPAGAVMIIKQWYDNTADNPNNPDPDQWVDWGSRTADEMDHAWIAVTHLDEEGYQELLAEREQKESSGQSVASAQ